MVSISVEYGGNSITYVHTKVLCIWLFAYYGRKHPRSQNSTRLRFQKVVLGSPADGDLNKMKDSYEIDQKTGIKRLKTAI